MKKKRRPKTVKGHVKTAVAWSVAIVALAPLATTVAGTMYFWSRPDDHRAWKAYNWVLRNL